MTAAIPQLTVPTQVQTATTAITNGKPEPAASTSVIAKEEAPKKSIPEIEASNRSYLEASQKLKIDSAIAFIEKFKRVELYMNPNGGSNAVVLYNVSHYDLTFICHKLSVGGFSTPQVDKNGDLITAIHDETVFNAYREKHTETPIITNFFEQQQARYEASLKAFQDKVAAKTTKSTTDSIPVEVTTGS